MKQAGQVLRIAFTYIGTIVGAGFATGQEIVQFFTRYGWLAVFTIAIAACLFVWLGTRLLLESAESGAESYEMMNKRLFGEKIGAWISHFMLVILFGITTVMLAGAGSLFEEHLHVPYQAGLVLTLLLAFFVLNRGMDAILSVNTIVVPIMLLFTCAIVWSAWRSPGNGNWLRLTSDFPLYRIWASPLLYAAFNLAMAQAVLVPMGAAFRDKRVLTWGGIIGGAGIGLLLLAGHFALSAQMPGVTQFEIPMGHLARSLGSTMQLLYVLVIFGEIFTTFIADAYGLALQISGRTRLSRRTVIIIVLLASYLISQIGFSILLSTLYPLFGVISLIWFVAVLRPRTPLGT